jgi:hypothetical protein
LKLGGTSGRQYRERAYHFIFGQLISEADRYEDNDHSECNDCNGYRRSFAG